MLRDKPGTEDLINDNMLAEVTWVLTIQLATQEAFKHKDDPPHCYICFQKKRVPPLMPKRRRMAKGMTTWPFEVM